MAPSPLEHVENLSSSNDEHMDDMEELPPMAFEQEQAAETEARLAETRAERARGSYRVFGRQAWLLDHADVLEGRDDPLTQKTQK